MELDKLLEMYIEDKINTVNFSNNFTIIYSQDTDYSQLDDERNQLYGELHLMTARFSPYREDFEKYPNVYYSKDEIRLKAEAIWNKINAQ